MSVNGITSNSYDNRTYGTTSKTDKNTQSTTTESKKSTSFTKDAAVYEASGTTNAKAKSNASDEAGSCRAHLQADLSCIRHVLKAGKDFRFKC